MRAAAARWLEALGPLNVIGAQLVYIGQPFLRSLADDDQWQALAYMLQDPDELKAFIAYLQSGKESPE